MPIYHKLGVSLNVAALFSEDVLTSIIDPVDIVSTGISSSRLFSVADFVLYLWSQSPQDKQVCTYISETSVYRSDHCAPTRS